MNPNRPHLAGTSARIQSNGISVCSRRHPFAAGDPRFSFAHGLGFYADQLDGGSGQKRITIKSA